MMHYSLTDMDVEGKTVLVRVDLNVSFDDKGNLSDDTRLKAIVPTLDYLISKNAKIILISHLGRPEGSYDPKFSLAPVAPYLSYLIRRPVNVAKSAVGNVVKSMIDSMHPSGILLLENIRFYPDETSKNKEIREKFAKHLASLGDIYVNDAFGVSHREQASITEITKYLPSCAGMLLEKETKMITAALENAQKPFYAIIGGAKADKIGVIRNLLKKVDGLLIGGILANTFLKAKGVEIGKSKYDDETLAVAQTILQEGGDKIILPIDAVVSSDMTGKLTFTPPIDDVYADKLILDLGPKTVELYCSYLKKAKTIVWAGPVGAFEIPAFSDGTKGLAACITSHGAFTIVGGGDSAAAMEKLGYASEISHISTGGGASLEMFEGKVLPGIKALEDSYARTKN